MESPEANQIKGLSVGSTELLSAVGVEDLVSLAQSDERDLFVEIQQANAHLKLEKLNPTKDEIAGWIEMARGITGKKPGDNVIRLRELVEETAFLPVAILVDKESIVKNRISVGDVPVMEDFVEESDYAGHGMISEPVLKKEEIVVREIEPKVHKKRLDPYEIEERPKGEEKERSVVEPLKRNAGIDIRKTASPELNEGKKLHSRSYVRGVLHPQPARVKVAAFITFMTLILFPASFVAGGLVAARKVIPFEVSLWLLAIPAVFLIFGFFYLTIARPLKCRICGQPLFSPKACRRHVKAHRFPLLGIIFPTSMHMLFFHWFRCIYCGTSVRLKE